MTVVGTLSFPSMVEGCRPDATSASIADKTGTYKDHDRDSVLCVNNVKDLVFMVSRVCDFVSFLGRGCLPLC